MITALIQKYQNEFVLFVLALLLLGAGMSTTQEKYNPFEAKTQEVDRMIQDVLKNPTEQNLGAAQDELFYNYYPWAERQTSENKDTFIAYLEACNQVIIQKSNGIEPDTSEMNSLKNQLL